MNKNTDDTLRLISQKALKQAGNGFLRIIILWQVNKGPIHGYGIMKKIDSFHQKQIEEGILKKATPSKIYPILKKMEENNLIEGYWEIKDNKNIKYYRITKQGLETLEQINYKFHEISLNPIWKEFIGEMVINKTNFKENK